jgi:hypothetical protein
MGEGHNNIRIFILFKNTIVEINNRKKHCNTKRSRKWYVGMQL